jgi:protein TonB
MKPLRRVRVVVSFRGIRLRTARFMTGSMAVHGALLAAVLVVPATRHRVAPIDDTMIVALAGPLAVAATPHASAATAAALKPAPPPPPLPKEAHTVREVPLPKPKEKPVKPKPEPETAPEPAAPSTQPATPSTGPAGGKPGEAPGAAAGAVTATVGGGDNALGWYGAAVKAALESVWIKPYLEDAQGTASVVIAFDIARDGTTRDIRVLQPSGIPSLDRSAQRAVIEAAPFPMIPPSWTGDTIPVTMRFDLSPEPR